LLKAQNYYNYEIP
jgi:Ran GTPase-activating protein (RanGAP) involved in mRNA processing and transport